MARHYSTRDFFRQMPNALLARYFQTRGLFGDLDFSAMKESQPDELFAAWLRLPDGQRNEMDAEFRDIFELSCEKGFRAIIDEAEWHLTADPDARTGFVENLAALSNHYERAMVTFLDHNQFWKGATRFYHADTLPYWRKRKNLPHQLAAVDEASLRELVGLIRTYFHHNEGRGNTCVVEPFRRGELDYFFAYPEDYSQQSIEWVNGEFSRPHNPAFEVIYVYSQKEGSLDLNFRGSHKPIEPLQWMFATAILKLPELPPDPKDGRIYDLNPLCQKGFDFAYDAGSGIQDVARTVQHHRSALSGIIGVVLAAVTEVPGVGSSLCPSGWICPVRPIISPSMKIGTWYELYWQTPDSTWPGQHWALWTRYKPVGGYYSSGDPTVVQSQFAQIKAAGIDYVLLDHTNGIWNDNGEIEKNAKSIFDTDDQLTTDQRMPLAFVLGTWGYSTVAELQAEADHVWSTYASRLSYLLWKGKPLLVDYGAYDTMFVPDVVRSWTDPHFTLRHAVEIANSSNPLLQQFVPEGLWGWYLPEPQLVSPETIAVAPGYDRQHAASPAPASIDRQNGMHYTREWLFAIKHNPENIILPSWNDFAEETQIEPSINVSATPWVDYYGTETPDWYVQITSDYTHLRTGLMLGSYYRDEDNAAVYEVVDGKLVYQSVLPHGNPVIFLPAGTLKALLTTP